MQGEKTGVAGRLRAGRPLLPRRANRRVNQELRWGLIFISPAIVFFVVFWALPVLLAIYYSVANWSIGSDWEWVGLSNYVELVQDPLFLNAAWNSVRISFMSVSVSLVLALGIAWMLTDRGIRGSRLFLVAFMVPVVTDWVATALVWQFIFLPNQGVLASIGAGLGIDALVHMRWTSSGSWAPVAVSIFIIWKQTGLYAVFFYAALRGIPKEVLEAAQMDGASPWQEFWRIKWPMMTPITVFIVVLSFITTIGLFEPVFLLTGGGPVDATRTLPMFLFENFFTFGRAGYASAAGVYFLLMSLAFAFVATRILRDQDEN